MGWGLKTPIAVCDSVQVKGNFKAGGLVTAGLGIALVFCLPGQVSQANYSSVKVNPITDIELASTVQPMKREILAGAYTGQELETTSGRLTFQNSKQGESNDFVQKQKPKSRPVQLASLELDLPKLEKPKDFLPPQRRKPIARNSIKPLNDPVRPRLQKKLFGTVELRFDDERKIKAWSSVYYKFLGDTQSIKSCLNTPSNCHDPVMAEWASNLKPLRHLSTYDQIAAVNSMANRRAYSDDLRNYGKSDYWAGPREFLTRGGDCEDYALLKFASLLALGVDEKDLRLVVGRLSDGTPHAFLAANVAEQEYILDNRQSSVYLTQNRKDYVPKYSMNLSYRWSHVVPRATTT